MVIIDTSTLVKYVLHEYNWENVSVLIKSDENQGEIARKLGIQVHLTI